MWNPVTNRVSEMHDVTFLQRMFYQGKNSKEIMKEPTVTLQVTRRNSNNDDNTDDGAVIQDEGVPNPNDISGLEAGEGTRVTFEADANAKRPTEASSTKDTTWIRHVTR